MKTRFFPGTRTGKTSIGLFAASIVLYIVRIFSKPLVHPSEAILFDWILLCWSLIGLSALTALVGVGLRKERSLLVYACMIIAILLFAFGIAELFIPS